MFSKAFFSVGYRKCQLFNVQKPKHSLAVVSGEATCVADVCILIVFLSGFMDPQGAAEPEVATHNISAVGTLLTGGSKYFYIRIHVLDIQFCFPNLHRALFCFIRHGPEGYISTGLTSQLITCALF